MDLVVASDKLERAEVWAEDDESVGWAGAFAVYGDTIQRVFNNRV